MRKITFIAGFVFIILLLISHHQKISIEVREINASPKEFSAKNPKLYPTKSSWLQKNNNPKWEKTYRYVIIARESSWGFESGITLREYQEDAIDPQKNANGNLVLIFSNSPSLNKKIFKM